MTEDPISDDAFIGAKIARIRGILRYDQVDLARRIREKGVNWSQGTLSKVEAGARPVRLSEAPHVADVLGVELGALLPGGDHVDTQISARVQELALVEQLVRERREELQDANLARQALAMRPPSEDEMEGMEQKIRAQRRGS
jgi:transcriptional regulator with XRE-family HTH domain